MRRFYPILAMLMLAATATSFAPGAGAGQFSVFVGTPNVQLHLGGGGNRGGIFLGNPGRFHRPGIRRDRLHGPRPRRDRFSSDATWGEAEPRRPDRPRRRLRRLHPFFLYPNGLRYGGDRVERADPPPAPPAARPAPPPDPVVETEPPDPRGPARRAVARGLTPAVETFPIGEALPAGLPHVMLDWRYYDLPEPPAGRIYARVGRTILLITPEDRIVERIVEPG
ncbi:MAG: hypothetical protein OEN23_17300 [Paracoccaceae bacterium]|nr:hypothetical protein [Paracoccaceae bacterium]